MLTTIYYEFSKQLADSSREDIIRNGRGTETPATPIKGRTGTKVQVVELNPAEYTQWLAAQVRNAANVWAGFGGRR